MDPGLNSPTTPTEAGQGYYQEQSNLLSQAHSLAPVQGGVSSRQFIPASNVFPNSNYQSVQQDRTHFQPHIPSFNPYQPGLNGQNGHNSVANLTPSSDSLLHDGADLAHAGAVNQQTHSQQIGHNYPATQNFYPNHTAAAVASDAWMTPEDCLCGPKCNCLYCASHPYNRATSERVQTLTEILARDNYWDIFERESNRSLQRAETRNAFTDMETAMNPMVDVLYTPNPLGNGITPKPNDSDHSIEFAPPQMEDRAYRFLEYPVQMGFTNATGTDVYRNESACHGSPTHQGHVRTHNLSELPHL